MKELVKAALNKPVAVIVSIMALVLFATVSVSNISLKLMPDMSIPYLVAQVTYPGADPEEIDELIIDPMTDAVESISGLTRTQGTSNESYGYIVMQFEYGTDMNDAYDDVKVALDGIKGQFPEDAKDPTLMEIDMNSSPDITLSITSESSDVDVLSLVNNEIEPKLKTASALAEISTSGGDDKYISVQIVPELARQYGLDISSVVSSITAVNFSMPAGSADYGNQKFNISSEVKYETIPELEQVPISTSSGEIIHLSDIAKVKYAVTDKSSLSRYDGEDNISITLKRKQSSTSVKLSGQIKKIVEELRANYPSLKIEIVSDAADNIIESLMSVLTSILEAIGFAMLVLFIFFGDLKGALIVASSMPISLLATVILMNAFDLSLNMVTMNALVLGIGMMTDNAVVVIEMCFRHRDQGMSFKNAAYEGTTVVINSVIGSTITSVVVYLPLAVMEGLSGQMFKQLGFTIIFTLISSLVAAITLVPLFFSIYKPVEKKNKPIDKLLDKLSHVYGKVLAVFLRCKKRVFVAAIAVLVLTFSMTGLLKTELMSSTDEGIVNLAVTFRSNLALEEMDKVMLELEEFVKSKEEIESFTTTLTQSSASGSLSAYKYEDNKKKTQEIVDEWNEELVDFSPMCEVKASASSTTGTSSMSAANSKEFDLVAEDKETLKEVCRQIQDTMKGIDGVLHTESSVADSGAKVKVVIDPVMAQKKGFTSKSLASLVYMNMSGSKALSDVMIDSNTYDVKVEFPDDYYKTVADVEAMTFTNSAGASVPLTEMAEVKLDSAPSSIQREDGKYYATVTATMTAATKDKVSMELEQKIRGMELPEGVRFSTDAMTRMMSEEFSAIGQAVMIALFLVFAVMAIQFESIIDSFLIMFCVPFALIGSIVLLLIMNAKVSMSALMGILMLAGMVVNNGIILIDMAIQNQHKGMETEEALVDAGMGRLRPILITTLTTELAMIPVAFGFAKNSENMAGMAIVMVGGLLASTVLSLLFLPVFYLIIDVARSRFENVMQKRRDKKIARRDRISAELHRLKEKHHPQKDVEDDSDDDTSNDWWKKR